MKGVTILFLISFIGVCAGKDYTFTVADFKDLKTCGSAKSDVQAQSFLTLKKAGDNKLLVTLDSARPHEETHSPHHFPTVFFVSWELKLEGDNLETMTSGMKTVSYHLNEKQPTMVFDDFIDMPTAEKYAKDGVLKIKGSWSSRVLV